MEELLKRIEKPGDIKNFLPEEYPLLARQIRKFLVQNISRTGGHLASNLGVVELTMALHLCLDLPEDKIVFDVGHQAYTHKILTGRKEGFQTLRQYEGLSGFPKRGESLCDAFDTGHSSTSVSVAMGMAKARDLQGKSNTIVAVIGDGALSGGMAYEALNNAAHMDSNLIIILNDNNMSISENVGGMANYLNGIRTNSKYLDLKDDVKQVLMRMPKLGNQLVKTIGGAKDTIKSMFVPGMLFEEMGLTYLGPINGHDIKQMVEIISRAKAVKKAVIIHVNTKKGKGYRLAEQNPSKFHGVEPFYIKTGEKRNPDTRETYTEVFKHTMTELGAADESIVAVSAAMPDGTGMDSFAKLYPERFFDVGIAEEHAVTFAAGMAAAGLKPVVALYSTFLQRSYDQLLHDVCIGSVPVVIAIDRAGIVGSDGETHQGIFDISFLNSMPGMTIMAPKDGAELKAMLEFAIMYQKGPVVVRYPRGIVSQAFSGEYEETAVEYGRAEILSEDKDILLFALGSMAEPAKEAAENLILEGYHVSLVNARFAKPFDGELIERMAQAHHTIVTLEENIITGGFSQQVSCFLEKKKLPYEAHVSIALPEQFIEHGDAVGLREKYGLSTEHILKKIKASLAERNRLL